MQFFQKKGLAALKDEDRREEWYDDWIAYQAEHQLYATLLTPRGRSSSSSEESFDLLRYARFLELIAYFSPAHGYSLQVTFLGLFPILISGSDALKAEALATLKAGGLFALGVSERAHGSDLLANEFRVSESEDGRLLASGIKYYIGNSNVARMICVLASRKKSAIAGKRPRRATPVLFALRPERAAGFQDHRKIRTFGVRAAHVGEFALNDQPLDASDVIAEGRDAWDAVIGTVTLGKFFLGFGSVGICEHAFAEAMDHVTSRVLYGKPVVAMPHIRLMIAEAYARLTAMKLYAYRALDYVHAARAADRRHILFCAVQKARVSTEGTRVMALLLECMGARGFESDTYFEMALRDVQLIPGLEGSTHFNINLTAQFIPRYFSQLVPELGEPSAIGTLDGAGRENPFLMDKPEGAIRTIGFPPPLRAYESLLDVPNVRRFVRQITAFGRLPHGGLPGRAVDDGAAMVLAQGRCQAIVAYGQLVAEQCAILKVSRELVSIIFQVLVTDMNVAALALGSLPELDPMETKWVRRLFIPARATAEEWEAVAQQATATTALGGPPRPTPPPLSPVG